MSWRLLDARRPAVTVSVVSSLQSSPPAATTASRRPTRHLYILHQRRMRPLHAHYKVLPFWQFLFKFAQISFKILVNTGPNFPNFVKFGGVRDFSKNESQTLVGARGHRDVAFGPAAGLLHDSWAMAL
jgi:hypothetical protein